MSVNIYEAKRMAVDLVNGQSSEKEMLAGANQGAYFIMDDLFEIIEVAPPGSDKIWQRFYLPEYIDGVLFAASEQTEEATDPIDYRLAPMVAGFTMQVIGASRQVIRTQQLLSEPSVGLSRG